MLDATHLFTLWLDNTYNIYHTTRGMAQQSAEDAKDSPRSAEGLLADTLEAWAEDQMPKLDPGPWGDLLAHAFGLVDWYEIAGNMLEEIEEER